MNSKWVVHRTNAEYISYLSRASSISPALAQALVNRGIKTTAEISDFLSPSLGSLSDPLSLDGVAAAVEAIEAAKKTGKRIFVHGDYDADGTSATAIMVGVLKALGHDVCYFIPDRFRDGYGFNPPAVKRAKDMGAGLIITVDCGITSFDAVSLADREGIGVIITDHHQGVYDPSIMGGVRLPSEAIAVVNPKVSGGPPLAGAGVALKLAMALAPRDIWRGFLDIAALGTIADSVPLTGENRAISKEGLAMMNGSGRPGIRALKEVSGNGKGWPISYTLVPRINAAGRMADASVVVELLLTDSEDRAFEIARLLDRKNAERQRVEEDILGDAVGQVRRKGVGPAIVLSGEGWHEGVIGIVASKIAERFNRPAFVFSIRDGMAKGSARSVHGFDIHAGISGLADMLIAFGGHKEAAGLTLRADDLALFEKRISEVVERRGVDFTTTLSIDADMELGDINFKFMNELLMFEPCGEGNPEPVFGSRGLRVIGPKIVGNNHLKMKLGGRARVLDAIGFDMGGLFGEIEALDAVDAAYTPTMNEWGGTKTVQLNLKGLRAGA